MYSQKRWLVLKKAIRYITPPILVDIMRRLFSGKRAGMIEYEYVPEGWRAEQSDPKIKGWNDLSVLEAYKANWPNFVRNLEGRGALAISPECGLTGQDNLIFHNTIMSYAYALAVSTRNKSSISMLDWGGGIGHYYLISQALVPDTKIDYHCKDVPVLAEYGQKLFPEAHFYEDESCFSRKYDFVLAITSLHYSQDWTSTLKGLAQSTGGYIFITRLPVVHRVAAYVMVQRPYNYGYNTEYLGWVLNREEFLKCAQEADLKLLREFILGDRHLIHNAPEQCEYRGFLFQK